MWKVFVSWVESRFLKVSDCPAWIVGGPAPATRGGQVALRVVVDWIPIGLCRRVPGSSLRVRQAGRAAAVVAVLGQMAVREHPVLGDLLAERAHAADVGRRCRRRRA